MIKFLYRLIILNYYYIFMNSNHNFNFKRIKNIHVIFNYLFISNALFVCWTFPLFVGYHKKCNCILTFLLCKVRVRHVLSFFVTWYNGRKTIFPIPFSPLILIPDTVFSNNYFFHDSFSLYSWFLTFIFWWLKIFFQFFM